MRTAILFDATFIEKLQQMHSIEVAQIFKEIAASIKDLDIRNISIWRNFMSEQCLDKSLSGVLNENIRIIGKDERSLILSRMGKEPYVESIIEDYENENQVIISSQVKDAESKSLSACYISKIPMYDAFSGKEEVLEINCVTSITSLDELHDEEVGKSITYSLKVIGIKQDIANSEIIFEEYQRYYAKGIGDVLRYLDSISSVYIYPDARGQIVEMQSSVEARSIVSHLIEIGIWSSRLPNTDFSELQIRGSEESRTTLRDPNLMRYRTFNDGKGNSVKFSYHTKAAGGMRIYLKIENDSCVSIGYVGKHLPN